jgi:hypothetical protein
VPSPARLLRAEGAAERRRETVRFGAEFVHMESLCRVIGCERGSR